MAGANPFGMNTGMGNMGGLGGMNPTDMANAMNHFRNNPEQVRAMMQNPMVQQMLRNDPRMANNPMMQQGLDMMLNNPQLMEQAARMMGNPAANAQMEQLASAFGGGSSTRTGGMGMSPPNNGSVNNADFEQQMQMMQQMMGGSGSGTSGTANWTTATENASQGAASVLHQVFVKVLVHF